MAIGEEYKGFEMVDWGELWDGVDSDEPVIDGLAYKGRWTAIAAQAKAGKSTLLLGLAVATARAGMSVLYFDTEMTRQDMRARLEEWMELGPDDLGNLHYCDLPGKLDTAEGSSALYATVERYVPSLVIIDGLNGVVAGGENDDTTWRDLYEWSITPCKARGIAVISADNLGKDTTRGPRGSSVKLDKADAVIELQRTNLGAKLTATHRRTAAFPREQHYVIAHADEDEPPMVVVRVDDSDPEGTSEVIAKLWELGLPVDIGVRKAREALRAAGFRVNNAAIGTAVRTRRKSVQDHSGPNGETPGQSVPGPLGTIGTSGPQVGGPGLGPGPDKPAGQSTRSGRMSSKRHTSDRGPLSAIAVPETAGTASSLPTALEEQF